MEEVALILVILAGLQLGKLMLRWNRDRRDNDELRQIRELNETMRGKARFLPSGSQIREWEQNMVAAHGNGDEDAQDPRGWDALDREMRARVRQLAADGVPSLALFGTGTGRSDALLRDIESIAERLGFGSLWPDTASAYAVRESLRSTDVTLVDCTVESENGYEVVQYGFYSEFAVVVSSSALPVNFPSLLPVAPTYPTTWPHEHLLSEVERRLRRLVAQCPRETGPEGYRSEEELAHEIQMAKLSAEAGRKAQGQVFVSYRSRHGDSVRAWLDDAGDKTVKVFSPGELALDGELMTEQRRWQVFRQLRQWISTADEFVMYLTDDYYDSWWTRAELLALASLVAPPPIHVVDPETGRRSSQTVDNLVVALSATDDADLTRLQYFAFAPEWLHRMRRPDADLLPPLVSNLYTEEVAERFLRHERRMPCPSGPSLK